MVQHVSIQSADTHEPKHITAATVVDAGKVITPSGSVNGESELRRLNISDVETDGYTSPFSFWATYQIECKCNSFSVTFFGQTLAFFQMLLSVC